MLEHRSLTLNHYRMYWEPWVFINVISRPLHSFLNRRSFFATLLAANFSLIDSNSCQRLAEIVAKLLCAAIWSGCALQLESDSYLSRTSLLGQVIYQDLLFRTGFDSIHADSFQRNAFAQRPMIDQKIEPGDVRCFGLFCFLAKL